MNVTADDWCEICPICEGDMSDCVNCDGSGLVEHECEGGED